MNVKAWLNRARNIDREIDSLLRERSEMRDMLFSVTSNYEAIVVSGTKDPHKFDRLAILETEIDSQIDNLVSVKAEILRAINKLDDGRFRDVLRLRYLESRTFEQIAVEINYSYKQTCRIHGRALLKIEEALKCSGIC